MDCLGHGQDYRPRVSYLMLDMVANYFLVFNAALRFLIYMHTQSAFISTVKRDIIR